MYPPPRADINAPDMYIPVMGFVTYIIFCAIVAGIARGFQPEMLGIIATKALVFFAVDVAVLRLGYYILANTTQSLLDCAALCGYVFVGVALNELAQMIGGKWLLYPCLLFTWAGMSVFLMHTVRVILLSDPAPVPASAYGPSTTYSEPYMGTNGEGNMDPSIREQNYRRYYLFFLAFIQLVVMYFLAYSPVIVKNPITQGTQQQFDVNNNNGPMNTHNQHGGIQNSPRP